MPRMIRPLKLILPYISNRQNFELKEFPVPFYLLRAIVNVFFTSGPEEQHHRWLACKARYISISSRYFKHSKSVANKRYRRRRSQANKNFERIIDSPLSSSKCSNHEYTKGKTTSTETPYS